MVLPSLGDRVRHLGAGAQHAAIPHRFDANLRISLVGKTALLASACLNEHLVTTAHQIDGGGNEGNAPFQDLGF
jgi:hypothetical protein